jgi:hypothetical protein
MINPKATGEIMVATMRLLIKLAFLAMLSGCTSDCEINYSDHHPAHGLRTYKSHEALVFQLPLDGTKTSPPKRFVELTFQVVKVRCPPINSPSFGPGCTAIIKLKTLTHPLPSWLDKGTIAFEYRPESYALKLCKGTEMTLWFTEEGSLYEAKLLGNKIHGAK